MWLMALGSAIHNLSSCTHAPVKSSNTGLRRTFDEIETYLKRTVPADDISELLEEPLIRCPSLSGLEIPLVS